MKLIDRSPGVFAGLCFAVVYGVVCAEIWMCASASYAATFSVLGLVAVIAVLIGTAVTQFVEHDAAEHADEALTTADAPAPAPTRAAAGRTRTPHVVA